MKKMNLLPKIAVIVMTCAILSCSDSEKEVFTPAQNQQKLILAALESNPALSEFAEAFRALDLSSSDATAFTILALKNGAAENGISAERLKRYILANAYAPSDLVEAGTVKSLDGVDLVVKSTDGVVALNNTPIGTQRTIGDSYLYTLDALIPDDNTFLAIAPSFEVALSRVARLRPEAIALENATFEWTMTFEGQTSVVSTDLNHDFIVIVPGEYTLTLNAALPNGKVLTTTTTVTVADNQDSELSPYPNRVFDFVPAPGQYVNNYGATKDEVLTYIYNNIKNGAGNIYMGAFGGYMIVGFDHTIMNRPGYCDFTTKYGGGNVSPSTIWVAYDANANGQPDNDEWYEIKGSEHGAETDLGMQSYTYETTKGSTGYAWTTQSGETGIVTDTKPFATVAVPSWITAETYTLTGRQLLPTISTDPYKKGHIIPFPWGYAGNQPNGDKKAAIDIDWAIDALGNPVRLPGIDFVKVINAIQGKSPATGVGEYRYQVTSIEDLHLNETEITTAEAQGLN
jgi:hypothetical protein